MNLYLKAPINVEKTQMLTLM